MTSSDVCAFILVYLYLVTSHFSIIKGIAIQAISAVDLAIWDALGKVKGVPVYELLGGKTKEKMPCYATTARPDLAKEMGFLGAKFPLPYGPASGEKGMK